MKGQLWDLGFSYSPVVGVFYFIFSYLKGIQDTGGDCGPYIAAANHFLMLTEFLENEWASEDTSAPLSIFGKPSMPLLWKEAQWSFALGLMFLMSACWRPGKIFQ